MAATELLPLAAVPIAPYPIMAKVPAKIPCFGSRSG